MKLTAAVTVLALLGGLVLMVQAFPPKVKENPTPTIQWQDGFAPVFDAACLSARCGTRRWNSVGGV
jgi:hypothetical protein